MQRSFKYKEKVMWYHRIIAHLLGKKVHTSSPVQISIKDTLGLNHLSSLRLKKLLVNVKNTWKKVIQSVERDNQ